MTLILASGSQTRRQILEQAGLSFRAHVADVDEDAIKRDQRKRMATAASCAMALAQAKAENVARQFPGEWVLGCDQMLECNGQWFDKAKDKSALRQQLQSLRGQIHTLQTALCLMQNHVVDWQWLEAPMLRMRAFSDDFLQTYLDDPAGATLHTVGGYSIEGRGIQLFAAIEGDIFTIMGLPLLPLLQRLQEKGLVAV